VQLIVTGLYHCCYIVARPGSCGRNGRPIYMVGGSISTGHLNAYMDNLIEKVDRVLDPFFSCTTIEEVVHRLPVGLSRQQIAIITSRWPFFHAMRREAVLCNGMGFPPSTLFKSSFQSLYNVIKGGLDANTQQYISIRPNVKVSFEQKYVIRMILANVSNSWRAFQLFSMSGDLENLTYTKLKTKVNNSKVKLQIFCMI
jgi:hypothetical protein